MFLVPTTPTRNFLEYDRLVRKLTLADAYDRLAEQEAIARIFGRTKYRGPSPDFILAYERTNPMPQPAEAAAAN